MHGHASEFFFGILFDQNPTQTLINCPTRNEKTTASILSPSILLSLSSGKHPEVLQALRKCDFTFLEHPDFSQCFKKWSEENKQVALVGKNEGVLHEFKEFYQERYPNLQLRVYFIDFKCEGEGLEEIKSEEERLGVELSHRKIEILLVDIPSIHMAEIVNRLSAKLNVPVVIGFQADPPALSLSDRLRWNYLKGVDYCKHKWDTLKSSFYEKKEGSPQYLFFGQEQVKFSVLVFPSYFGGKGASHFADRFDFRASYTIEIVDLSKVKFIDQEGLVFLQKYFKSRLKEKCDLFILGVPAPVKRAMQKNHLYDYFYPFIYNKREQIAKALEVLGVPFVWAVNHCPNSSVVYFFGQLDVRQDQTFAFENITAKILGQTVVFNFEWCYYIDSSGLGFLLRLRKLLMQVQKKIILTGINDYIKQVLKLTKVDRLFEVRPEMKEEKDD